MKQHLHRWGWVWLLVLLWLAAWAGQLAVQAAANEPGHDLAVATLENWQSEFLQLAVQAGLVVGAAGVGFRKANETTDRIEAKVDTLLDRTRGKR